MSSGHVTAITCERRLGYVSKRRACVAEAVAGKRRERFVPSSRPFWKDSRRTISSYFGNSKPGSRAALSYTYSVPTPPGASASRVEATGFY